MTFFKLFIVIIFYWIMYSVTDECTLANVNLLHEIEAVLQGGILAPGGTQIPRLFPQTDEQRLRSSSIPKVA